MPKRHLAAICGILAATSLAACLDTAPEAPKAQAGASPTDPPPSEHPADADSGSTPITDPSDGGEVEPPAPSGDAGAPPPAPSDDAGSAPPAQCGSVTRFPTIVEVSSPAPTLAGWNDTADATSLDGQGASAVLNAATTLTQRLYARGFGFAIPTGTKIQGVVVEVTRQSSAEHTTDGVVRLAKKTATSGTGLGDDQARTGPWPVGPYFTATYGSPSSRWNATLSPTVVNAASFAVQLSVFNDDLFGAEEAVVRVDAIKVTVHYCP